MIGRPVRGPALLLTWLVVCAHPIPLLLPPALSQPRFVERAEAAGLGGFVLSSGDRRKRYIIEATSGGVCVIDYDSDELPDIFFVNGGRLDGLVEGRPSGLRHALFRNLGELRFTEVTSESGTGGNGHWGMGCSVTDFDADGRADLYITAHGPNQLLRNRGDGTFEDATERAGVDDPRWSTGSAWADADLDGDVDLFVANYIELDGSNLPEPGSPAYGSMGGQDLGCTYLGLPVMCGPRGLQGAGDSYYVNRGDGTFEDKSLESGLGDPMAHFGLGAVFVNLDDDTLPELFVANDSTPNLLYRNRGRSAFDEIGLLAGVALDANGVEQAGMGVAVGDFLNSGAFSLYVTHFSEEYNTLYRNEGGLNLTDVTTRSGLARPTLPYVGWGTVFLDADNDGWLDLFVANGHVFPNVDELEHATIAKYAQRDQLFLGSGTGLFQEQVGVAELAPERSSRGAAVADFDVDGNLDLVVSNMDSAPSLYWNRSTPQSRYLRVRLVGIGGNRLALNARVRVRAGDLVQLRELRSGGSYLSSNEMVLHYGLGERETVDTVEVLWPDGQTTVLDTLKTDRQITIRQPAMGGEVSPQPDGR